MPDKRSGRSKIQDTGAEWMANRQARETRDMPLPLPGSPAASWASFSQRLRHAFKGADLRVCVAFWLLGLINNVLYVVILSAALDLVGPSVPKGVVLLADVIPSFLTKLLAPYFIHKISYPIRVIIFVCLSASGMLLISLTPSFNEAGRLGQSGAIATKMVGVVLASLSSGGGELSFVSMVHYYGPFSLAAWGSGTGGAGLVGAGVYALATSVWGFSVKGTLLASATLPAVMLFSFFILLPRGMLKEPHHTRKRKTSTATDSGPIMNDDSDEGEEQEGLLSNSGSTLPVMTFSTTLRPSPLDELWHNINRARSLFFPYMLPLLLVYIAEYTINQGVAPTLLFALDKTPFEEYRSFYPTYNAIYQCGVFISRSSTPFFRIHNLYLPSLLQVLNLLLLTAHSMFDFIPTVYIVFIIIFWEGLLGGLVYVNTFAEISDNVDKKDREFSLGATTVSDSGGICIAGFISMAIELSLCNWQVHRGKDWCRQL